MTLTKAELIMQLQGTIGMSRGDAAKLVDTFFELIVEELEQGTPVKLSNFGNFQLRDKAARPGRNPKTGVEQVITARRVVTFHASAKVRDAVEAPSFRASPA